MEEPVPGNRGDDAQNEEILRLRVRLAALEEENDILAKAAAGEQELMTKVQRLTDRVVELERENEQLSEANRRFSLQAEGTRGSGSDPSLPSPSTQSAAPQVIEDPAAPFVVPGDKHSSIRITTTTLSGCHSGTNVLCARTCPTMPGIMASGGADKSLLVARVAKDTRSVAQGERMGHDWTELHRLRLPAPVLSMDFCPTMAGVPSGGVGCGGEERGLLLAGGMDGSSHLIAVGPSSEDPQEEGDRSNSSSSINVVDGTRKNGVALVASMKDHAKYVVVCRWAPDGRSFITASHDKVVTLYTLRGDGSQGGMGDTGFEQATRLYFPEAVESAEFVTGEGGSLEIAVSARTQSHLTYVNVETLHQRRVSLNEKDWDTHVSFTVMSLAASPDGKYLLGATDKSRVILWRAGSNARIRTLMGHTTDDYFQPRVAWEPSGLFSYCNSSLDHDVHVHCLASGRVVERLKGHSSVVRDMYHDPARPELITASYDKAVKIWRA